MSGHNPGSRPGPRAAGGGAPPAVAVIGAGFGDEGKGAVVDRLAGPDTIVVRANGGADAGHTVVTPDGRRFVFRHIGAGAFQGAGTYLSRFFIHNPLRFIPDFAGLKRLGVTPAIYADPAGRLTTPLDMMLEQIADQAGVAAPPGGDGLGIAETIRRHDQFLPLTIADDPATIVSGIARIRREWVPARLDELGIEAAALDRLDMDGQGWRATLADTGIDAAYLERLRVMQALIGLAPATFCRDYSTVVFENAQGLLCDAGNARFAPYVAATRTGLTNVVELCREIGVANLTPHYVTRAYMTRRGPGLFPSERHGLRYADQTNRPDDGRGEMRFGLLDLDLISQAIAEDLRAAGPGLALHRMTMTCIDQTGPAPLVLLGGNETRIALDRIGPALKLGRTGRLQFQAGPGRDDILRPEDMPRHAP